MFYSHEILTNRQHGVATIWLVATLGSKSNLKKVTRRAILDVDVPKACDTITDPAAPMALRLQGSLLYGVSRVYSQQCGYVLADIQSFRDKMRGVAQVLKEMELDPDIGKTRPEQLNLPDDPAFVPDLDMDFDLSIFDIPSGTSVSSSLQSPRTLASCQSSLLAEVEEEPGLDLPSIDTPGGFGGFALNLGGGASSTLETGSRASAVHQADPFEGTAIDQDPEFEIDDDGNIQTITRAAERAAESDATSAAVQGRAVSDSGFSARVRAEHEAGVADQQIDDRFMFSGALIFGDDEPVLPPALPYSLGQPYEGPPKPPTEQRSSAHPTEESTKTALAEAPQRRIRPAKHFEPDQHAELSNKQLGDWNTNYLANMEAATRLKHQHKSLVQAKKNAAFWVLRQGIGGVEVNFGDERVPHPFSIFSGQALLDAVTGRGFSTAGAKRHRSVAEEEEEDEGSEARRVRARTADEEHAAQVHEDEGIIFGDDEGILPQGDDYNLESEVGRNAPASLQDHSSGMPWNISLSRQSSTFPYGSAGLGISSSVGGPVWRAEFGPPSALGRRGSRLTSASPLHGKGAHPLPGLEIQDSSHIPGAGDDVESNKFLGSDMDIDDFELYGPSAAVDTQTAEQSQWVTATLENEAHNFLTFLDTQIQKRVAQEQGMTITLDELLPPATNSKVVGAQAILHVLALVTKGLIDVYQEEAFGDIEISVIHGRVDDQDVDDG